jgi:hypothetical protein
MLADIRFILVEIRTGVNISVPTEKGKTMENKYYWTMGWSGDVELGVGNGYFLPRRAAVLLHPEYFDENGNPILEKLPMDGERREGE